MKRSVYIETSVASYLTARPSRDLVVAAHQELTAEWWARDRQRFDLYISGLCWKRRPEEMRQQPQSDCRSWRGSQSLASTSALWSLRKLIPQKALEDALHVAIATVEGMDFLLTWNCRHIANAEIMRRLEAACLELGYRMPLLCTPEQLVGD